MDDNTADAPGTTESGEAAPAPTSSAAGRRRAVVLIVLELLIVVVFAVAAVSADVGGGTRVLYAGIALGWLVAAGFLVPRLRA